MLSDDVRRTVADALPGRRARPRADPSAARDVAGDRRRRRLRDPAAQHPPPLGGGRPVNGHKVGLSSQAMQEMMGVDEPDYGHLLSDMDCRARATPVPRRPLLLPAGRGRGRLRARRRPAGRGLHRGRRARGPRSTSPRRSSSSTAGSSTGTSRSPTRSPTTPPRRLRARRGARHARRLDLKAIDAVLVRNGEKVADGRGRTPCSATRSPPSPGSPTRSAGFGVHPRGRARDPARLVHRAIDVAPGDEFVADFDGLGSVRLSFSRGVRR